MRRIVAFLLATLVWSVGVRAVVTATVPNRFFRIITAVRPPDLTSKAQINTLRVAEVRLTPIP